MRPRFIIFLMFFVLFTKNCFAQPNILEKYWFYRERLKNFVRATPNYNDPGTNLPADWINGDVISWDDGNAALNHYISVLATEYRLLKNNGLNYTQTIKDLYYALKSFERLDKTAESYYRVDGSSYLADINGFFIRRDITYNFWDKYGAHGTNPYFLESKIDSADRNTIPPEQSEDNVWHHLEALSLAHILVDNESINGTIINFKKLIDSITYRIVNNLNHSHYKSVFGLTYPDECYGICTNWYVENPVTELMVDQGDGLDGTILYASYGFREAAKKILGTSYPAFPVEDYSEYFFKFLLSMPMMVHMIYLVLDNRFCVPAGTGYIDRELWAFGSGFDEKIKDFGPNCDWSQRVYIEEFEKYLQDKYDDYELRSLCATGNISDKNGLNPYEVLIKKQFQSEHTPYEHLPLIWSVLNNDNSHIQARDLNYIRELLFSAPICGPDKWLINDSTVQYDNIHWSSTSRLVWPEDCGEVSGHYGEFNGLDYMLLHNLYWLTCPAPANYLTYIQDLSNMSLYDYGAAKFDITCNSTIDLTDFTVELTAGSKVRFDQGFKIIPGNGTFKANVGEIGPMGEPLIYSKKTLTNYPCNPIIGTMKAAKEVTPDNFNEPWLHFFPNPVNDYFEINSSNTIKKVEIYTTSGSLVKTYNPNSQEFNINTSFLQCGIYIFRIIDEVNNFENIKIIKQ